MREFAWAEANSGRRQQSPNEEGLTGLQEALQLHRADELLPVVRAAGNDAQQLLGHNNAKRVRQVGFVDGGDEERAAWLRKERRRRNRLQSEKR